jgi:hypothetical protein
MLTEQAEWCGGLACFHRQTREYGHLLANLYRHQPRASPHTVSATASVPPRKASLCWSQNENDLGHVWTAPPWQELSDWLQHWSGAVMCPACLCGDKAAGHNALRGSGPNQKHAFKDALTQAGSPDPRIDLVCITSSVLANSFKTSNAVSSLPGLTSLKRSGFDANQSSTSMPRSGHRPQHQDRGKQNHGRIFIIAKSLPRAPRYGDGLLPLPPIIVIPVRSFRASTTTQSYIKIRSFEGPYVSATVLRLILTALAMTTQVKRGHCDHDQAVLGSALGARRRPRRVESDLPMKTKTHFAFRIDIWDRRQHPSSTYGRCALADGAGHAEAGARIARDSGERLAH